MTLQTDFSLKLNKKVLKSLKFQILHTEYLGSIFSESLAFLSFNFLIKTKIKKMDKMFFKNRIICGNIRT